MSELYKAFIEIKDGRVFVRCPRCNAWDRALSRSPAGIYKCEECSEEFLLTEKQVLDCKVASQ